MNFQDINYKDYLIDTPYPEVNEKNERDMETIMQIITAYTGNRSELNATHQYIYQSFIVKPEYSHLSKILERIAIVEMEHLEILSQVLLSFGVNPKFCKYIDRNPNICDPYSTNCVKYITDIPEFLKYNISLEENAIKEYTQIVNTTPVENVKEIISRIIEDEKSHLLIFNKLLEIAKSS